MITSRTNAQIKNLAALQKRKNRQATQTALAEGVHLVQEALRANISARALVVAETFRNHPEAPAIFSLAQQQQLEVLEMTDLCYQKISTLQSPEGVALVIPTTDADGTALLADPNACLLIAAGVQDPGNAGALVRTAEAAGASGCCFLDSVDLYHPRFLRGAQGSSFRLPCASITAETLLTQENDCRLIVTSAESKNAYDQIDWHPPMALCMGGEGLGLPQALLDQAHDAVSIPMKDPVESLNVAVAAGILLYEARKAWF